MMTQHFSVSAIQKSGAVAQAVALAMLLAGTTACLAAGALDGTAPASASASPAMATPTASAASTPDIASGRQSRAWLDQQVSRQQASRTRQTLSGPVMSKVHQRYLSSFEQPIGASIRDTSSISNK